MVDVRLLLILKTDDDGGDKITSSPRDEFFFLYFFIYLYNILVCVFLFFVPQSKQQFSIHVDVETCRNLVQTTDVAVACEYGNGYV